MILALDVLAACFALIALFCGLRAIAELVEQEHGPLTVRVRWPKKTQSLIDLYQSRPVDPEKARQVYDAALSISGRR